MSSHLMSCVWHYDVMCRTTESVRHVLRVLRLSDTRKPSSLLLFLSLFFIPSEGIPIEAPEPAPATTATEAAETKEESAPKKSSSSSDKKKSSSSGKKKSSSSSSKKKSSSSSSKKKSSSKK